MFRYTDYVLDVDETFLEGVGISLESPLLLNMFILHPKVETVERSVYEFFQMLADIGGFNDGL